MPLVVRIEKTAWVVKGIANTELGLGHNIGQPSPVAAP